MNICAPTLTTCTLVEAVETFLARRDPDTSTVRSYAQTFGDYVVSLATTSCTRTRSPANGHRTNPLGYRSG